MGKSKLLEQIRQTYRSTPNCQRPTIKKPRVCVALTKNYQNLTRFLLDLTIGLHDICD